MHSLPVFVRLRGKPVILIGDGDAAEAKRRILERAGAVVVGEETEARLAIVALENGAEEAVALLRARGILVNAVDRPELCDFTLPAIIDRDPVLIAIGTGGASAGLAKALRQRMEAMLPQALGRLAEALYGARDAIRARWPEAAARRKGVDAALDPGGPLDPFGDPPEDAVERWLSQPDGTAISGLHTIALSSEGADDLTLRQARLLAQADWIVYGAGVPAEILARGRADAVRIESEAPPAPLPGGLTVMIVRKR
jgi:uroporphyrin-III C-methyltransferase/precorrin-2 dehydrogenase/sirohydrochlorin ferrochelatase